MKKVVALILVAMLFVAGCSSGDDGMERAMALRSRLLASGGYSFDADVSADYGDKVYTFSMSCQVEEDGTVAFAVMAPESIAGITGTLGPQGGQLTFDGTALAFEMLADGRFSPVSAPWILVHTLHSGYLTSCAKVEGGLMLSIDDSFCDDALNLTVYLGSDDLPAVAEISWQGRRILSLRVKNFAFR